ncbi:acyl-CoA thioesterase [Evansella cellulosilytica]|uniref:Thioesterase superfamily protein n=1 Tax=Evansella cellulosilytica (strain ATCC 21833 / DSM 2522 / FERM P-1141 / JCM 9156 / N-4) TaxID=649639 RepID=E6U0F1_EVAC2|nr:thioesterase family protein [Evansella cellulosilytica]ADU31396.1 thioesterase superfamily protein [Evansella cellulosilytica DSM 2522]
MNLPDYIGNFQEWKQSFRFFHNICVRFSETDAFGHMNNTNAFVYFEEARINFLRSLGLTIKEGSSVFPVTADIQCNYLKQIFFDETIKVAVKVVHVGNTSVELHYIVLNENNEVCLTGRGRIVQISSVSGKPEPWSDHVKERLKKGS